MTVVELMTHKEFMELIDAATDDEAAEENRRLIEEEEKKPLATFSFAHDKEDDWQSWVDANEDPYGKAIMRYAARWASMMEAKISEGDELEKIADKTSHEADIEGITGFMYGAAVSMLSQVWIHGEQLRQWHNIKTQFHDEGEKANESGGVLNPALLNVGG